MIEGHILTAGSNVVSVGIQVGTNVQVVDPKLFAGKTCVNWRTLLQNSALSPLSYTHS